MLIKKFKAKSMQEALKMVKDEFGLDAMILNSREDRPRGIKAVFSKPYCEVTAAMAPPQKVRETVERPVEEKQRSTREEFRNSMLEPLAREIRQLKEKVETLYERDSTNEKLESGFTDRRRELHDAVPEPALSIAPKSPPFEDFLTTSRGAQGPSLESINDFASKTTGGKSRDETKAELLAFAEKLRENGVETDVADSLVERVLPFVGRKRKTEALRKGLREALENMVDFAGEDEGTGRRIIALVGPSGVGKTTTIVKMAAAAADRGKQVAVVTTDSMKADAGRLLKQYGGNPEITVNTAATPQKLMKTIKSCQGKDIILVDTAGISPNDNEAMEALQTILESCPGIEKHLCLSSTTRDRELDETVRRFERYAVDRLIFTRLDESSTFGSIINVLMRNDLPLSYLTSGGHIDDSIEIGTAERLSELATVGRIS
jgi:flagellar biosynthesis protein FlhF